MFREFDFGKIAFANGLDQAIFADVRFICTASPGGRDAWIGIVICALQRGKTEGGENLVMRPGKYALSSSQMQEL